MFVSSVFPLTTAPLLRLWQLVKMIKIAHNNIISYCWLITKSVTANSYFNDSKISRLQFGLEEAVCFNWNWLWASCGYQVASQHLIENGGPGWCCFGCGLAPPFRLGFRSIEEIKWTLPALAATPLRPRQLKGCGHTICTSLTTLMWFRCHIPHLTPTHFGDTLSNVYTFLMLGMGLPANQVNNTGYMSTFINVQ